MVGAAHPPGAAVKEATEGVQLVTAGDVHIVDADSVAIVQLRAPLSRSGRASFREAAATWIASLKPSRVVFLTGIDAVERIEPQLTGSQIRCAQSLVRDRLFCPFVTCHL